jgi:hypothetical protein
MVGKMVPANTTLENIFEDNTLATVGLPSSFSYTTILRNELENSAKVSIKCQSLNNKIPDETFRLSSIALPAGTYVSLWKEGPKIWDGNRFISDREWKMREQIQQGEETEKSNKKQQYYLIALISTGVALAICVYLFWFRRRSHKTSPEALSTHPAT